MHKITGTLVFNFRFCFLFSDTLQRLRQNFLDYFFNIPDMTQIKIPEGANTTSTTKVKMFHRLNVINKNQQFMN